MVGKIIMSKTFIRWAGGKGKLIPQLKQFIPKEYNTYIEPFLGGGSMFFYLKPTDSFLSDINEELINLYRVLRNNVEELIGDLKTHKNESEYYYQCRDYDRGSMYHKWTDIERASRTLYLNKTCWNGLYRVNSSGYFNVPFGDRKNPMIVDEDRLRECSKALQNATIAVGGYESILDTHKFVSEEDFVYLDPPYAPVKEDSFTSYTKEDFGKENQIELKRMCDKLNMNGVYFMLSNSAAPFILKLYDKYFINIIQAPRYINSDGNNRGNVEEVVITNYSTEKELKDFWEI